MKVTSHFLILFILDFTLPVTCSFHLSTPPRSRDILHEHFAVDEIDDDGGTGPTRSGGTHKVANAVSVSHRSGHSCNAAEKDTKHCEPTNATRHVTIRILAGDTRQKGKSASEAITFRRQVKSHRARGRKGLRHIRGAPEPELGEDGNPCLYQSAPSLPLPPVAPNAATGELLYNTTPGIKTVRLVIPVESRLQKKRHHTGKARRCCEGCERGRRSSAERALLQQSAGVRVRLQAAPGSDQQIRLGVRASASSRVARGGW